MSPARPGPGRWSDFRILWLAQVQAALDDAAHCRAVAGAAAALQNHEAAGKHLDQAQALVAAGQGEMTRGRVDRDTLFDQWSAKTGIDHKDPEALKKVYEAIAEMNRAKAEKTARTVKAKQAAATRAARGQPGPGKMPGPKKRRP